MSQSFLFHVTMQVLDLTSNKLSGSIPDELGNSPKLAFLYLGFNLLEGRYALVPVAGECQYLLSVHKLTTYFGRWDLFR